MRKSKLFDTTGRLCGNARLTGTTGPLRGNARLTGTTGRLRGNAELFDTTGRLRGNAEHAVAERPSVPGQVFVAAALLALALALLSILPAAVHGQSAGEIMRRAMDAQASRLAMVNDVTITQDVMGMSVGMYMEKRVLEGTPVLVPVSMIMDGRVTAVPQDEMAADWSNPFQQTWAERTRLEGTDQVDGHRVRVLVMDDFTGLDMPSMPGEMGSSDIRMRSMRFSLDDDHLIRKVEMDAQAVREDGTATPVQIVLFMEDFREVGGYLHPFRTRTITKGVLGAVDVDQEELRAQLEEMKKQLASMPEAQRAMMERMMGPQMESLQAMLSSEEGDMEMTITVTDLKVNAGPPGGED